MRVLITVASLIVPVLDTTSSAVAQSIPADSGQRVLVALRAGPMIEGSLVRQTPERLVIRAATGDTLFLVRDVERVASPTQVHTVGLAAKGLGFGLLGGAILGGVVAAVSIDRCSHQTPHNDMCGLEILAVPAAALLGGVVGTIVGSVRTRTEWKPIWTAAATTP